jgi:hypothetical protein
MIFWSWVIVVALSVPAPPLPKTNNDCQIKCKLLQIKSNLARLGIRNFKPTLRKAAQRLATVHTPEGIQTPWPSCSATCLVIDSSETGSVANQPAGRNEFSHLIDGWNGVARCHGY